MTDQLPLDSRPVVQVGPLEYRRGRDEQGRQSWLWRNGAGHWASTAQITLLVDEIVRLRAELEKARSIDLISTQVLGSPDDQPANRTRHQDHETSAAGARAVAVRAGTQKHRLLTAYSETSGLTDEEAAAAARLPSSSCWWKRCSELRDIGAIKATDETREGAAGVPRIVCSITEQGWNLLWDADTAVVS